MEELLRDSVCGFAKASAEYPLSIGICCGTAQQYLRRAVCVDFTEEVVEAISANVSVLKTATVLRLENGEFYGWEGLNEHWGSCRGHMHACMELRICAVLLFPNLERSIRETDFEYNQDENGRMVFRMKLPLGRAAVSVPSRRSDGRGDKDLPRMEDMRRRQLASLDMGKSKKSLEYARSEANYDRWDRDMDGVFGGSAASHAGHGAVRAIVLAPGILSGGTEGRRGDGAQSR